MAYVQLSSAKYVEQAMKQDIAKWKRARSRKAIGDFVTFVYGVVGIYVGLYAVNHMDVWMPPAQRFLASTGLF